MIREILEAWSSIPISSKKMSNSIEKQLIDLEEISYRISDLINENKYTEILDLDKKRNQIIEKYIKIMVIKTFLEKFII